MQCIISTIEELYRYKNSIDKVYKYYGMMPQHSFYCYYVKLKKSKHNDIIIFLDDSIPIVVAFEKRKKDGIYQSIADLYPIMGKYDSIAEIKRVILCLANNFNIDCFYFPLMNASLQFSKDAVIDHDFMTWNRLECPIFRPHTLMPEETMYPLSYYHPHSREKKLLRFAYVKELTPNEAPSIIQEVETMSWKCECKQDMISRNQIDYYLYLIEHNIIKAYALIDNKADTPIAYRLDAQIHDILYVLKWSYNQDYRQYSPGYYLVARELFERYSDQRINEFNLYGSPDSLKDKIENARIQRIDCCFVLDDQSSALNLMKERLAHDQKVFEAYHAGLSIKTVYLK